MFQTRPQQKSRNVWATFKRKFESKIFQNNPNQVVLIGSSIVEKAKVKVVLLLMLKLLLVLLTLLLLTLLLLVTLLLMTSLLRLVTLLVLVIILALLRTLDTLMAVLLMGECIDGGQCDQKKLPNVYKSCPKMISQEN